MRKKKDDVNPLIIIGAIILVILLYNALQPQTFFTIGDGTEGNIVFGEMNILYKTVFGNFAIGTVSGGTQIYASTGHSFTCACAAPSPSTIELKFVDIDLRAVEEVRLIGTISGSASNALWEGASSSVRFVIDQGVEFYKLFEDGVSFGAGPTTGSESFMFDDFIIRNNGTHYLLIDNEQVLGGARIREGGVYPHRLSIILHSYVTKYTCGAYSRASISDINITYGREAYIAPPDIDLLYGGSEPSIEGYGVIFSSIDPITVRIFKCHDIFTKGCIYGSVSAYGFWADRGMGWTTIMEVPVETITPEYIYYEYPLITSEMSTGAIRELMVVVKGDNVAGEAYKYYKSLEYEDFIGYTEGTRISITDLPSFVLASGEEQMHEFIFDIEGLLSGSVGRFELGLEALPSGETIPVGVSFDVEVVKE